jgi:hypothetical protein
MSTVAEVPGTVLWIWGIVLAVAVLVILPIVVILLHRIMLAARQIERYFAEMAAAGVGIAENTSHIKALENTISVATSILGVAGDIVSHSGTVRTTLANRASRLNGNGNH